MNDMDYVILPYAERNKQWGYIYVGNGIAVSYPISLKKQALSILATLASKNTGTKPINILKHTATVKGFYLDTADEDDKGAYWLSIGT